MTVPPASVTFLAVSSALDVAMYVDQNGMLLFGSIGGVFVDPTNDHVWVLNRPRTLQKDEDYAAQKPPVAPTWTAPRTPDGQPDIQGMWSSINSFFTPLQRPASGGWIVFLVWVHF